MTKFKLSDNSLRKLKTCDERLQIIIKNAIRLTPVDFAVTEGYRNKIKQNNFFEIGTSKLKYPHSKHNRKPSLAVDIVPFINGKADWQNINNFCIVAGVVLGEAKRLKIELAWGGFWESFKDYPHFELCGS